MAKGKYTSVEYWRSRTTEQIESFLTHTQNINYGSIADKRFVAKLALDERCDEYGQLPS